MSVTLTGLLLHDCWGTVLMLPSTVVPFAQQQPPAGAAAQTTTAASAQAPTTAPQPSAAQGLFSGRSAPNLVNGLRQELPYAAAFAGLALRVLQPLSSTRSLPSLVTALLSLRPAATT